MLIPKVLIVCDSRTRSTEIAAYAIQNCLEIRGLRCDVEVLHHPPQHDELSSLLATGSRSGWLPTPPALGTRHHTEDYELVIVGTPAEGCLVSNQIAAFLAANAGRMKNLALLVTHAGSGAKDMAARVEELAGRPVIAELAVNVGDLKDGHAKKDIRPFVERVEAAARRSLAVAARRAPLSVPAR
jgi:flavodoxin